MAFNKANGYKIKPEFMETPTGESKTIEGQAFTVGEILERFSRGLQLVKMKDPVFTSVEGDFDAYDLEELKRMSLDELDDVMLELGEKKTNAEAKLAEIQKAKDEKLNPPAPPVEPPA